MQAFIPASYWARVEQFYHLVILALRVSFLFSSVRNIFSSEKKIQAEAASCTTGGFYYLIVHCSLFSLEKILFYLFIFKTSLQLCCGRKAEFMGQ